MTKITDEQIFALLDENKTNAEVARALGVKQTNINSRINKLRIQHERAMKPKPLRFRDIRKDDRLMKGKKRLIVLSADEEKLMLRGMDGHEFKLSRVQFEATAAEYTRVPPGDPQGAPVKTYIDPSQKTVASAKSPAEEPKTTFERVAEESKRKPATINQDFDDLFKPIDEVVKEAELISAIECAPANVEPISLDLEIEPITDAVDPSPRFEPVDYTDEDWFAIPPRGTIERRIWDRAFSEIEEYHKAKQEVESALISGGRLPGQITDKYNRIVSKYCEEVGA